MHAGMIYIYVYVCLYGVWCMYVCMVYMYVCLYVCWYVVFRFMYVCMYVCICAYPFCLFLEELLFRLLFLFFKLREPVSFSLHHL